MSCVAWNDAGVTSVNAVFFQLIHMSDSQLYHSPFELVSEFLTFSVLASL